MISYCVKFFKSMNLRNVYNYFISCYVIVIMLQRREFVFIEVGGFLGVVKIFYQIYEFLFWVGNWIRVFSKLVVIFRFYFFIWQFFCQFFCIVYLEKEQDIGYFLGIFQFCDFNWLFFLIECKRCLNFFVYGCKGD